MNSTDDPMERRRRSMVEQQVEGRGISDPRVLDALRTVPREAFVPKRYRSMAYSDRPLPIGEGQTISQPYIVALMAEKAEVEPEDRVLEIGTGSGYGAAVISRVAGQVYTVERHPELAEASEEVFEGLGYDNIEVVIGDGTQGLPGEAPFDAIIATASGPEVPKPFKEQVAVGGCIVMPVGSKRGGQRLVKLVRTGDDTFEKEDMGFVRFVPLIGQEGWDDEETKGADRPKSGGILDI